MTFWNVCWTSQNGMACWCNGWIIRMLAVWIDCTWPYWHVRVIHRLYVTKWTGALHCSILLGLTDMFAAWDESTDAWTACIQYTLGAVGLCITDTFQKIINTINSSKSANFEKSILENGCFHHNEKRNTKWNHLEMPNIHFKKWWKGSNRANPQMLKKSIRVNEYIDHNEKIQWNHFDMSNIQFKK